MQNDPELDPKFLGLISEDFIKVADQLKEASYQIRKRGFSDFPIFVVSPDKVAIGSALYEKGVFGTRYHYNASFMEDFKQRKLIEQDHHFREIYKDPDEFCCLFIVDGSFTNFLFIPYPLD